MTAFPYAFVTADDRSVILDQALAQLGLIPPQSQIGLLYATETLGLTLSSLIEQLRLKTSVPHWVGAVGIGICGTGREVYEQPALALMILDLTEDQFRIIPPIDNDCQPFLTAQQDWLFQHQGTFALVHGDPRNQSISELIERMATTLEDGFIVGGLSSAHDEDGYLVLADELSAHCLSGVLFSNQVQVMTGLTQGCSLIGPKHVITSSQKNIIATLDHRPALEVLKQELEPELAKDLNQIGGRVFAALPIPLSDTGDYLVRNIIGLDLDNQLIGIGDWAVEGSSLQFAQRDLDSAQDDLRRMLRRLKSRLTKPARGAVYHSCLGRGRTLFGEDSEELKLIQEELGDIPLVGFYASGEISHQHLYGYTGVLTLFL